MFIYVASVLIIGFGCSSAIIYIKGEKYTEGGTCPISLKILHMHRLIRLLVHRNWKYRHTNNRTTLTIEQKCPTMTHDANIYLMGFYG